MLSTKQHLTGFEVALVHLLFYPTLHRRAWEPQIRRMARNVKQARIRRIRCSPMVSCGEQSKQSLLASVSSRGKVFRDRLRLRLRLLSGRDKVYLTCDAFFLVSLDVV